MCLAPQPRAIFRHLNFNKRPEPVSFLTFWLANVLCATAACHFWTSAEQKLVWSWGVLCILTCKRASSQSSVPFFQIGTWKIGPEMWSFVHFDVKMCFAPHLHAIFPDRNFKNWSEHVVFCAFWLQHVLRATPAGHFSFLRWTATSAPAALARPLLEHQEPRIIEKTQRFTSSLTFGACVSSF